MKKLALKAREFADSPPSSVRFTPVSYKLVEERGRRDRPATREGVPFDDMEIGDLVVLCYKTTSYYQGGKAPTVSETWYPAECISAAEKRVFQVGASRWKEGDRKFEIWRVPYRWRQAVHKLLEQSFEDRASLEYEMAMQG